MGIEIDRESFGVEDRRPFRARLEASIEVLSQLLARPGFGLGPATLGLELELDLVDETGAPALVNQAVLDACPDPRFTTEIDQFNIEYNSGVWPLGGSCLQSLHQEITEALVTARTAAANVGAKVLSIGILPTLTAASLQSHALTAGLRYRALSQSLRELHPNPSNLRIVGRETLDVPLDDITVEGANTSLQLHLRTSPEDFADTYNAAQLAIAPALAVSVNSPLFLGKTLWEETRIALFRQSVDHRSNAPEDWRPARVSFGHGWVRRGALELFAESVRLHPPLLPVLGAEDPAKVLALGGVPELAELRLHQGTVWHWNRAVFDAADGGHLRVEMRALPSGPTPVDMVANLAFMLGLTLHLRRYAESWLPGITFGQARRNFYQAARHGLEAEVLWPCDGESPRALKANDLIAELLDPVADALSAVGVDAGDVDRYLHIIRARSASGRTGAHYQRELLAALQRAGEPDPENSLVQRYGAMSEQDQPVHTWRRS